MRNLWLVATNPYTKFGRIWFSSDEGATWQGPIPTLVIGIVPDKLLELPNKRWLLVSHRKSSKHGFLEERVWLSDTQGKTWSDPIVMASKEGLNLCEVSTVLLPNGTLVGFLRENSFRCWDAYKVISSDGGETWQGPFPVPLPGCHRPVDGMLEDNKLLITYRFLQGGKGWRGNWTQDFFAGLAMLNQRKLLDAVSSGLGFSLWTTIGALSLI